jgi:diguanylate cyclase (GGDEF)-like protein
MRSWSGKLRAWFPAGVTARGGLLIVIVALSVVVPAVLVQTGIEQTRFTRERGESEAFLAVALAALLERQEDVTPGDSAWLHEVAQWSDRVRWAGVFDRSGRGLEFRRRFAVPEDSIVAQIDFEAEEIRRQALRLRGTGSQRFELVTVPGGDQDVIMAAVIEHPDGAFAGAGWWYMAAFVVGVSGLLAAWLWFVHGIQRPITRFKRALTSVHAELTDVALGGLAPVELQHLVDSVAEIQREMRHWQSEATHLRHTVEARVDAGTRRAARAQRRAEREADVDPLTRLLNRRALERDLPELFTDVQVRNSDMAIAVVDIDNFKPLNDTHGHKAGDELIAFVGELIRGTIRKGVDCGVRLGGDEFIVIMADANLDAARAAAERLVKLFAQRVRTLRATDRPCGLSVGVASLRRHGAQSWHELLQLADAAMYCAKRSRRGVATVDDLRMQEQRAATGRRPIRRAPRRG